LYKALKFQPREILTVFSLLSQINTVFKATEELLFSNRINKNHMGFPAYIRRVTNFGRASKNAYRKQNKNSKGSKVISKFVHVLNLLSTTPRGRMGNECIYPPILDIGTSWRSVVSFTPRPLYTWGNSPQYQLDRRLGGSQNRSGQHGEEKNLTHTGTRTLDTSAVQPIASH
jgi:hypothetical protein